MRSYPLSEAKSEFANLVERALAGEPQRVIRQNGEAVIVVAETAWNKQPGSKKTLVGLFEATIGAGEGEADEFERSSWSKSERQLGEAFGN